MPDPNTRDTTEEAIIATAILLWLTKRTVDNYYDSRGGMGRTVDW